MSNDNVPEWMSTLGRMAMQVEGEVNRLKAIVARADAERIEAISDLLELIEHAAGNGFDCHPDADDRVIRARAVLLNEYPRGARRDDAPDYRTAEQFYADNAHQRKRDAMPS